MNPLKTYSFNYSIDGIFTEQALYLTVKAYTLRKATAAARQELKRITAARGGAHWVWEGPMEGPCKPVFEPDQRLHGRLYLPGHEVKPIKPRTLEQIAKQKQAWDTIMAPMLAKLGPDPFAPIREVIDKASPISALFKDVTFDYATAPSIPLVVRTPMPRDQWPSHRNSKWRDNWA
jgi:hypothetical protein